jgi:hypothetical protein
MSLRAITIANFKVVFDAIRQQISPPRANRKQIGFRNSGLKYRRLSNLLTPTQNSAG